MPDCAVPQCLLSASFPNGGISTIRVAGRRASAEAGLQPAAGRAREEFLDVPLRQPKQKYQRRHQDHVCRTAVTGERARPAGRRREGLAPPDTLRYESRSANATDLPNVPHRVATTVSGAPTLNGAARSPRLGSDSRCRRGRRRSRADRAARTPNFHHRHQPVHRVSVATRQVAGAPRPGGPHERRHGDLSRTARSSRLRGLRSVPTDAPHRIRPADATAGSSNRDRARLLPPRAVAVVVGQRTSARSVAMACQLAAVRSL